MKKTAVLLYDTACLFELTVALEMLQMAGKPVVYLAKSLEPVRTEEGMQVLPDKTFEQIKAEDFDSILITGGGDAREMVEDPRTQDLVRRFYETGALIGAISIAPILLLKLGYLKGQPFMIGVEKGHLYEEGFTDDDMKQMVGWEAACQGAVPEKFIRTGPIITSVAFGFRQWAMAIGEALGLPVWPKSFDLE